MRGLVITRLRKFLHTAFEASPEGEESERGQDARVAIAALLVEMSRADFLESPEERQAIRELLASHFSLEKPQAEALLGLAHEKADQAVSLQQFTREIHESLSMEEKLRFLDMLMRIALADGHMDKHERHLLGKIADLIYVPKADYVTLRDRILAEHGT
jgi:uncharacterized tellurite resistance protein B-like protein